MQRVFARTAVSHCGVQIGVLLLLAGVVHSQSLLHPFFLDDYVYLSKAHDFGWSKLAKIFTSTAIDHSASSVWWAPYGVLPFYRPVAQLTFIVDYFLWGLNPFGFHLTNVLLHMLCTLLTWRLAMVLFQESRFAFATSLVFAVHPIHREAVAWVSGRFDALVCACILLSLLAHLRWSTDPGRRWVSAAWSVFWFVVGLGCKETALVLPGLLIAVQIACRQEHRVNLRRFLGLGSAYAIVGIAYLTLRSTLLGGPLGELPPPYGLDTSSLGSAVTGVAMNSGMYLLDLLLCIPIEPALLPAFWRENLLLFLIGLAIGLALLTWIILVARSRVAYLGLAWLIILIAPSLLSMPGERNIYSASVGFALLLGAAYRGLARGRLTPAHSPSPTGRLRRVSYAIVCFWMLVAAAQGALMGRVAFAGEKVYSQLEALVPAPPPDARVFVVHQSPLNSVGFAQALRLRYGRPDITGCALTLSPTFLSSATDEVTATGRDTIRITRAGSTFFSSFAERFHLFSQPPEILGELGDRFGVRLLNPPRTLAGLRELDLRLPYPVNDPRLVILFWDNQRIRKVLDLRRIGELSELVRWTPDAERN